MPDPLHLSSPASAGKFSPPAIPPVGWRLILRPLLLAILGMMIAWAAACAGRAARRDRDSASHDLAVSQARLALLEAQQSGAASDAIAVLQKALGDKQNLPVPTYDQPGREFTNWDAFRYEQIAEQGYVFHQPGDSASIKDSPTMLPAGASEPRLKNVSWYPLYPLLGWLLAHAFGVSVNHALTAISWISCALAAIVTFAFLRRFFHSTNHFIAAAGLRGDGGPARGGTPNDPQNAAALWAVVCLLFGPCSIFLYANFTESLFVLLLAAFLYCVQARWWWRAALIAAIASASRSQGVLFGPILALVFLIRAPQPLAKRIALACALGIISAVGIIGYMIFLQVRFGDALAFMHAQKYWNVGISASRLRYAADPLNAFQLVVHYAWFERPVDWPRVWEALCTIWPPVILVVGWRRLSLELAVVGWLLWLLPYVSNCMAGNPPLSSQWMSMGRFMAVLIPAYAVLGVTFARRPWLGVAFTVAWSAGFAMFCYACGSGEWVG